MKEYWSCTKFADYIRGIEKPNSADFKGWDDWDKEGKQKNPIRFWFVETFLDKVQDIIMSPIDLYYSIKYYIDNRWVTKTHCLIAHPNDIKPGSWRDEGDRFLPCLFNSLVDYVEVSVAQNYILWSDKDVKEQYAAPFYSSGPFRLRSWRCLEAGLDYLNRAKMITYTDKCGSERFTTQAINAAEILELYNWWKDVYPTRIDPIDASGLSEFYDEHPSVFSENFSEKEKIRLRTLLNKCNEIEDMYKSEDTEMMVRLIKVRDSMWV
jgi:hypothetical protein